MSAARAAAGLALCVALCPAGAARASRTEPAAGLDPTARVDDRGMSHLSRSPRRSPAGWLYAHPGAPPSMRPLFGSWLGRLAGEVEVRFDVGEEEETRFERFSDEDDALFLSGFSIDLRHLERALYLQASGSEVGREDQGYRVQAGEAGLWRLRGAFDRIRRRYASDARSLLDGIGTEEQRLRGGLLAGGNPTAQIVAAAARLRRRIFEVTRDRGAVRLDLTPAPALRLFGGLRVEDRDGERPFGGSLGFPRPGPVGQVIETAEPVAARAHELETGVEWSGERAQANLRYSFSLFRNHVDSLRFENPFDLGDPDLAFGRLALDPSNRAHLVTGDVSLPLPGRGRLSGRLAFSRHRQDEDLLPPTVQRGVINTRAGLLDLDRWNTSAALARRRADARIDRLTIDVRSAWTPITGLALRAGFHVEDQDDDTRYTSFNPAAGAIGYVSEDGFLEATSRLVRIFQPGVAATDNWRFRSIPTSFEKRRVGLEADYRIRGRTRASAQWERETMTREHRARRKTREVRGRVELVSRDLPHTTLRLGYRVAERDGSPYDATRLDEFFIASLPGYIAPFPGGVSPPYTLAQLRQFDLADRTLHAGDVRAHWLLREDMDVALAIGLERQDLNAAYGLRARDRDRAHLQWSWRPRPQLEAYLHYGFERRRTEMGLVNDAFAISPDPNAGGPVFPLVNEWTQRSRARVHSAGSGIRWRPHPSVELELGYTLHASRERVSYGFASERALSAGITGAEAGDDLPTLRHREQRLQSQVRVELPGRITLRIRHRYERSSLRDFAQRGLEPLTAGRAVFLAHVDDTYQVHVLEIAAQLRF